MSRQSVGVVPFKHIIKWLYPEAVAAFDGCAAQHDKDYKTVDWSKGDEATEGIDGNFLKCCLGASGQNAGLVNDAYFFFRVCRRWGKMRARLWAWGIRY